jgi:sugar phosphate isomerase/epimerase
MELMVFSKHLAGLPLSDVAKRLSGMGVNAIDLTVRPGGHIEPEAVADALPAAVEELTASGVSVGMLTTSIIDPSAPTTEAILRTASQLGIRHYKIGYFMYQGFGTLRKARAEAAAKLSDLAQINRDFNICGGYHNHSDNFVGASLWDIEYMIAGLNRSSVGLYFDPAHAVIEGGSKGWEMGMDLVQDRIVMLAVKDFRWVDSAHGYAGARLHGVQFCPLEFGNVPWKEVWSHLWEINFEGPISFHSEYQGPHAFKDLTVDEVFEQTGKDLEWWRTLTAV